MKSRMASWSSKGVGGAEIRPEQLDVELSTFASTATPRRGGSGEPFDGFAFQLKASEVQRFILHVRPKRGSDASMDAYRWTASLDLLVHNKRRTVEIDDDGIPPSCS
jgi:hypothetical protein